MSEEEKDSEAIKRVLSRLADNITAPKSGHDFDYDEEEEEEVDQDLFPCQLNQGRRLDYVLQVSLSFCFLSLRLLDSIVMQIGQKRGPR